MPNVFGDSHMVTGDRYMVTGMWLQEYGDKQMAGFPRLRRSYHPFSSGVQWQHGYFPKSHKPL